MLSSISNVVWLLLFSLAKATPAIKGSGLGVVNDCFYASAAWAAMNGYPTSIPNPVGTKCCHHFGIRCSIWTWTKRIVAISWEKCHLSGNISEYLFRLDKLEDMYSSIYGRSLNLNQLSGTIPSSIKSLINLNNL